MRRVIIVYDAHSERLAAVEKKVLGPARELGGVQVGKYKIGVSHDDAEGLAKLLSNGDIVVAAEGGRIAEVAVNGAVISGKDVKIAVMKIGKYRGVGKISKLNKVFKKAIEINKVKIIDSERGMVVKKR